MKGPKYYVLKLSAEFVLIFASVLFSFYIQGKIDDGKSKKEANYIMTQIRTDLVSDTLNFTNELSNANRLIGHCNILLNLNYETDLTNENKIDTILFFIGESISNLYTPIHIAGYTRLINFGEKEVIKNNALVDSTIEYYTIDKSKIESFYDVDRNYVDNIMVRKYLETPSYNVLNSYYTHNILGSEYASDVKQNIKEFLDNKEIRSLLIFNIINKANFSNIIMHTKESAKRKITLLDQWLQQKNK